MGRSNDTDRTIAHLARKTASIVHARDLRDAGIGRNAVATRIANGWMAPVVGRTYAVGPECSSPTLEMLCMAGVLAGGDGSRIDGETGATLMDLWNRKVTTIHVTVSGKSFGAAPRPFCFHRATGVWLPDERHHVGPIPVGTFEELVCSFANRGTPWQVAFVIANGIHKELCTLASLEDLVEERARVAGNATLRAAVALVAARSSGSRSMTEDVSLHDLIAAGAPIPIVNTRGIMGLSRDEPDFVWRSIQRNIEMDGRHHDFEPQLTDDRIRDGEAEARGWHVLRIAARDFWRRRRYVIREAMRFLRGEPVLLVPNTRRLLVP